MTDKFSPVWNGAITAVVTPMKETGEIDEYGLPVTPVDYNSFQNLLEFQMRNGIRGIVVNGTTGESPTVSEDEVLKMTDIAVKTFGIWQDYFVIVGTGANDTKKMIKNTIAAKKSGADAALVVTPYYNKPNKSGLIRHFEMAADIMPIIIYDIKGRTGRQIEIDEFKEIAKHPNVMGVKAASGDMNQIKNLIDQVAKPVREKRPFYVWAGDDALTVPVIEAGGNGVISVVSNLVPQDVAKLAKFGQMAEQDKMSELIKAAFTENNPVAIKHMMFAMKLIESDTVRLPLGTLSAANKKFVERAAEQYLSSTR